MRLFPETLGCIGDFPSRARLASLQEPVRLHSHIAMCPEHHDNHAENGALRNEQPSWQYEDHDDGPQASTPGGSDMHIQTGPTDAGDRQFPLPIWLRESSKSFHWRWVPVRVRQAARAVVAWSKGPDPHQTQKIPPFLPWIQEAPVRFINHYLPKQRDKAALLGSFYFCWLLTFILVLNHSAQAGNIEGYGKPQPIWCGASFW